MEKFIEHPSLLGERNLFTYFAILKTIVTVRLRQLYADVVVPTNRTRLAGCCSSEYVAVLSTRTHFAVGATFGFLMETFWTFTTSTVQVLLVGFIIIRCFQIDKLYVKVNLNPQNLN